MKGAPYVECVRSVHSGCALQCVPVLVKRPPVLCPTCLKNKSMDNVSLLFLTQVHGFCVPSQLRGCWIRSSAPNDVCCEATHDASSVNKPHAPLWSRFHWMLWVLRQVGDAAPTNVQRDRTHDASPCEPAPPPPPGGCSVCYCCPG